MNRRELSFLCMLGLGLSAVWGCSSGESEPPLAVVKGVIKLDGQPAGDLQVDFTPEVSGKDAKSVGAGSTATTDPGGAYELKYKGTRSGAVIGKHRVRITQAAGGGPAGGASAVASKPIRAIYNTATTLSADVAKGENKIDFDLTSK